MPNNIEAPSRRGVIRKPEALKLSVTLATTEPRWRPCMANLVASEPLFQPDTPPVDKRDPRKYDKSMPFIADDGTHHYSLDALNAANTAHRAIYHRPIEFKMKYKREASNQKQY